MTRIEVIATLLECKLLADRLARQGGNINLSKEDQAVITGFNKLRLENWLDDPDIRLQAGLDINQIDLLYIVGVKFRREEMRRQHAKGETIDDELS